MANELVVFEQQLAPLAPHFEQVLAGVMPVERLIRTAIVAAEKNDYLLKCDRQSFFNSIMTAGVLGLEMDGVTGQAFPVPFKKKVQLIIGYKGYNTLGARAGLTITGEIVREGDDFDYSLGTGGFVRHKPKLGNKERIIGAWAAAAANNRPPIISVMGIDDLLAVKDRAPAGKEDFSPWNDPIIGFPAMCSKTVKRRLCRSTPLNTMQLAARMEEAFEEQGLPSHLTASRDLIIDGQTASPMADRQVNETPEAEALMAPRTLNDGLEAIRKDGHIAVSQGGTASLRIWFLDLPKETARKIKPYLDSTLKPEAEKFDREQAAKHELIEF